MKPGPAREVAYRLAGSIGYAYRQVDAPTGEKQERILDAGENPPAGVIVHYWLRDAPAGDITLAFLDADGREIRSFTSRAPTKDTGDEPRSRGPSTDAGDEPRPTKNAGANRFVWNLRGPDATKLPDNKGRGGTIEQLAAPRVPPGTYQVKLTVGDQTLSAPVEVVKDPRVRASDADLRDSYQWAKRGHDLLTRVHDSVVALRDLRAQAQGWATRAESSAIKDAARALAQALSAVEAELIQVQSENPRMFPSKLNSRIATLVTLIEYSDAAPTEALRELTESLELRARMVLVEMDRVLREDAAAFNILCRDAGLSAIVAKTSG
jgi:hypothetical protein